MSYKIRQFLEHNYKSIYCNGKTLRIPLKAGEPITELDYPEFYDVKVTNRCEGACTWCYQNSVVEDHYPNIIEKFEAFFGPMSENERPFQIAYGGGEPTSHPDFIKLLEKTHNYGITPNYTTNGMNTSLELIKATQDFCGGVAVSCHPHLEKYWKDAAEVYLWNKVILNFHLIISDKDSIDEFKGIYKEYKNKVEYFVLLPLIPQGRAEKNSKELDEEYFTKIVLELKEEFGKELSDIAFGANFYKYLCENSKIIDLDISLYEPEIMSKYLSFEENGKLHPSSFSTNVVIDEGFFKKDPAKHEKFILEMEARTVKERQVYEGAKEKMPPLAHNKENSLRAAKSASR